ncbi:MAG: polysaccharide deacetylase family protein [Candidatus Cloacimonetes bacterium]|nr:polysaccharide deacetylase family protein [Candidatus Cloacimonadota bacterium]MDY0366066.1 polysaccharide deacetylase family protein [Candidatus Syntrophosphaera sp.]
MNSTHRIALSFDIEDWYHTPMVSGSSFSQFSSSQDFFEQHGEQFRDLITKETERLLGILKDLGISCTFFIVAEITQRYPELVNMLRQSEHEIACHGLAHHSALDSHTKRELRPQAEWYQDLVKAKELLEKVFQKEVTGYRAPNAYFASWMVPLLLEAGFRYDSSVAYNTIYNKTNVTLENIPSLPYYLNQHTLNAEPPVTELVELPWSRKEISQKLVLPAGGGYFFRLLGYHYFRSVISNDLKKGDTMFYMHPLELTREKIPSPISKNRPLVWINKGERTERNLIKLLHAFRQDFCTCKEVYSRFVEKK